MTNLGAAPVRHVNNKYSSLRLSAEKTSKVGIFMNNCYINYIIQLGEFELYQVN